MTRALIRLRDLIETRTGLFFRDLEGIDVLQNRLQPRLEAGGVRSFEEYHRHLSDGSESPTAEWQQVFALLAKPVSSFFRHTERTRVLIDFVMPRLLHEGGRPLKLWSAAC